MFQWYEIELFKKARSSILSLFIAISLFFKEWSLSDNVIFDPD